MIGRKNTMLRTKTGTIIVDGIEYKHYPPPSVLVKVMKEKYARLLQSKGILRLSHADIYQKMENPQLGDPHDTKGMFTMAGHQYPTGTVNPVFVYSMALNTISNKRVIEIAHSEGYDCVLIIQYPQAFFRKIKQALLRRGRQYWVHCGTVKYNRGAQVTMKALNSQQFNHNVFQKSPSFRRDKEYRLSVSDLSFHPRRGQYINLALGRCVGIVKIEKLPNQAL
jgi:hypothetical protein